MNRLFLHLPSIMIAALTSPASAQSPAALRPVHSIILSVSREIAEASSVNSAINTMVKDAAGCNSTTSKDPQTCACSFKDDLTKLKQAYDETVAKHPAWNQEDTAVTYVDPSSGKSVAIYFPGLKRQLETCAKQ